MTVSTTTGRIVDVIGPYKATSNDASILKDILASNISHFRRKLKPDDVFIVDRGFRDAIPILDLLGIRANYPAFLKPGAKQLSREDANQARKVTSVRWVVEADHARIKEFRFFNNVLSLKCMTHFTDDLKIFCAIIKKYQPPMIRDTSDDPQISEAILERLKVNSSFAENFGYISGWLNTSEPPNFPVLDITDLRMLTIAVYQLRNAPLYAQANETALFKKVKGGL